MSNPFFQYFSDLPTRRSLEIENFTVFSFQSPFSNITRNFVLYKYLHGFVVLCCAVVNSINPTDPIRWDLYISHWSTILCLVEAICGIFVANYFHQTTPSRGQRANTVLSLSSDGRLLIYLYLNSTAHTFSMTATILYWSYMYNLKVDSLLVAFEHSILSPILTIKLLVERMPLAIFHIVYPILFLCLYLIDVIVAYFFEYDKKFESYIFRNFDDEAITYFVLFALKCLLILSATHVVLVLTFWLKSFLLRPSEVSTLNVLIVDKMTTARFTWPLVGSKSTTTIRRLETAGRHDYIRTEWSHWVDNPTFLHLMYRFVHMSLFASVIVFSLVEPHEEVPRTVKYYCLWIFYMGNFFLVLSFLQSIFGFVVILKSFLADASNLKYYEKKESHVTSFQNSYSTINSAAVTLACFALCSSGLLVEDTGGTFNNNNASYESSHVINALAMFLDFLIVAHPFKMVYGLLSIGLLLMNLVFNYWLYMSLIKSRSGKTYIYDYLAWERPQEALKHSGILISMAFGLHLSLWFIFMFKRILSAFLKRRLLIEENSSSNSNDLYCYSSQMSFNRYDEGTKGGSTKTTSIDNQRFVDNQGANVVDSLPSIGPRGSIVWGFGRLSRSKKSVDVRPPSIRPEEEVQKRE